MKKLLLLILPLLLFVGVGFGANYETSSNTIWATKDSVWWKWNTIFCGLSDCVLQRPATPIIITTAKKISTH